MIDSPATNGADEDFLLLFRNTRLEDRLPMEEMREAMLRLHDWLDRWTQAGAIQGGQPLGSEGKVISGTKLRKVSDGLFAESKEAIGGYVLVRAANLDNAVKIAGEWPLLDYDASVEVRPILAECAVMTLVKQESAAAKA